MFAVKALFGIKAKQVITHVNADSPSLETIPENTNFIREGSGTTTITGSIVKVNVTVSNAASLRLSGQVGAGCVILKEGSGTLTFENAVADDMQLTVYGQGTIIFTQRPSQNVINSIVVRTGNARIICEGAPLNLPSQGYRRHNLGASTRNAVPEPQFRQTSAALSRLSENPPVGASRQGKIFNKLLQDHIDSCKDRKTIATLVAELNLSAEEEILFNELRDSIMMDYFTDVPVKYGKSVYNLDWLMDWHNKGNPDPYTKKPIDTLSISEYPAYGALNDAIVELNKLRADKKRGG